MVIRFIKKAYVSIIFIFLYAPIAVLILFSFNESRSTAKFTNFSLKWYKSMFSDPIIMKSLYYTLIIALLSAIIATIIGTSSALGIEALSSKKKKVIMNLTYLPIINPDIVTGISLMIFFIAIGIKLGFTSLLLAHITFNIPYVILSVAPKIRQLNPHTYEAALDLGAKPLFAFYKVILPEIMPGIVSGFLLAFTMSLDDFVISFFTTASGVNNLSITIYSMAKRGIKPEINALSTIMFVTVLTLLLIVNKKTKTTKTT